MCLVKRADDEKRVIRERLAAYHTQTAPLLRYFRDRRLDRVDAAADAEAVATRIQSLLASA
jgi:adenylate kinase